MTDLTRRTVLATGATGVAVTLAVLPGAAEAAPLVTAAPAARGFTREAKLYRRKRFVAQRTARFRVTGPGVAIKLRLTAIRDIPRVTRGSNRSFELTFTAPRRGPEQGTYTLKRRRFAATSLFLVPTDETRRVYRATVNNR
ncbi:hypothetical protein GUY44_24710 [Pimelobacter simplex]|uniref:DUF6916 domain-containing protein n=1 Tax=Nocardioides simplex TaxID=2045 RepID=A0A0A1DL86_NOCSI|nr:hypothetical protein [Pimelobacter simplex]AIY18089.1 hypothetical protein KR76_17340 [Pimelobacter simplex]MCG8153699.1 hypothetical protein [Pimelobacter simplex]GEB15656.1 hypothetical protein NSI01_39710 [Pimelobacter simplex]SFN08858.1 hypothetical protein SAMN05421671_5061 [Pimelobacter simplex]